MVFMERLFCSSDLHVMRIVLLTVARFRIRVVDEQETQLRYSAIVAAVIGGERKG